MGYADGSGTLDEKYWKPAVEFSNGSCCAAAVWQSPGSTGVMELAMQPAVLFSRMHISSAQQLRGRSGRTGPLLQLQRLLSQCVALWAATVRTNREHTSLAVQRYRDCSASAEYCLVVLARRCRSTAQRRPASLFEPFVFSH